MKLFTTLLLAVIHTLAGFFILMVASWFIAACSVAGLGFNYMLPAVVIRALAVLRIASGYFQMLLGHSHLLDSLAVLRYRLFTSLENRTLVSRKQSLDAMHHQSEDIAAIWIAWVGQNAGILLSLLLLNVVAYWLMPTLSVVIFVFTGLFCVLYAALLISMLKSSIRLAQAKESYQFAMTQHIESAPIWHLLADYHRTAPQLLNLRQLQAKIHLRTRAAAFALFSMSMLSLVFILATYGVEFTGQAVFLTVPIALLSVNDWLKPSLDSQQQLLSFLHAKRAQQDLHNNTKQLQTIEASIKDIKINTFSPINTAVIKQSQYFRENTVNAVIGSSGVGKSRFLQALAGLVEFEGERHIHSKHQQKTNVSSPGLLLDARYIEQFPYVLSDTLRANLLVANLKASDTQLFEVLKRVGLASLKNLDIWLGENGRPLSGGEKKRLGMARALLCEASVVLIDEPFEALDSNNIERISAIINDLGKSKIVVLATHIHPISLQVNTTIELEAQAKGKNNKIMREGI